MLFGREITKPQTFTKVIEEETTRKTIRKK